MKITMKKLKQVINEELEELMVAPHQNPTIYDEDDVEGDMYDDASDGECDCESCMMGGPCERKAEPMMGHQSDDAEHHEQEVGMFHADIHKTMQACTELVEMLEEGEEIPPWVQAKMTLAAGMIDTIYHYMVAERNRY